VMDTTFIMRGDSGNVLLQMLADRSQWWSSLRRRSMATRLLGSRVRIQLRAWTSVCCVCCVLCVACATGLSLVQRSLTGFVGVRNCVRSVNLTRRPRSDLGCSAREKRSCSVTARLSGKEKEHES
jgi:hypothetical protein